MKINIDKAADIRAVVSEALRSEGAHKLRRPISFTITCADGAFIAGVIGEDEIFKHFPHVEAQLPIRIELRGADDVDPDANTPQPRLKA